MEKAITNTRSLTSLERELLIEAMGNAVYTKRQMYKKTGAPETMEELNACKEKLTEIKAVEDLKSAIQEGLVSITLKPEEVPKELPKGTVIDLAKEV